MLKKLTLFGLLLYGFFGMGNGGRALAVNPILTLKIDAADKVVFDMSGATMNGNYVDIPVYILSNDFVNAIDFSLKYDEENITFDSVVNYSPYMEMLANFNITDRFLRFTSNSVNQGIGINKPLFALRFHFNALTVCKKLNQTDFNSVTVYLNGDACSYVISTPPPFKVPDADFSHNRACLGQSVVFNDASRLIKDSIVAWKWDFGNGLTSTSAHPSTTYGALTSYTVSLIVTSSLGCADTTQKVIYATPSPIASFTSFSDCMSGDVVFTDQSAISSGSLESWKWDFGDSAKSSLQNPSHNYYLGGIYSVSLTAVSDSGCTTTSSANVTVQNLSAVFSVQNGCVGESVFFNDSSSSTPVSGPITAWMWNFGDGTTSASRNTSHAYADSGTYIVSLKVTNLSCNDSSAQTMMIQEKPIVNFGTDKITGCSPLTINFYDSSITSAACTHLWDFGDGDTLRAKDSTQHTYDVFGSYSVKYTVTTTAGCKDSLEKVSLIQVNGAPVNFSSIPSKVKLSEPTVTFTNLSVGYNEWLWNFGDSTYSALKNPQYTFKDTGVYRVCLFAKDTKGCSYTHCDTVNILPPGIIALPEAFSPNGDFMNDVFWVRGDSLQEMELKIYNAWGNLLFTSHEQDVGWDGTFKGAPQPVGAYEYILTGKTVDDEPLSLHGVVSLIR